MRPANIQFKKPIVYQNNKPKHPYADLITVFIFLVNQLFFLLRTGRFVILYTLRFTWSGIKHIYVYMSPVPPIEDKPVSIVDQYIETKKQRFLETYSVAKSSENYSSNIDPCFLSKTEYQNLLKNENNDIEKKWKTRILCENTGRGNIFMFYDVYKHGFSYYSDIQGIPYSLLNAVAMKYVIMFRCRDFFVDDQITPAEYPSFLIKLQEDEDAEEKAKKEKKKDELGVTGINTKNAPFARFKTYNTASSKITDDDTKSNGQIGQNGQNGQNGQIGPVKIYTSNKFIYLGKTMNFSILQKVPVKPTIKREMITSEGRMLDELRADRKWLHYKDFKQSIASQGDVESFANVTESAFAN
jgi:hypothetical protein